MNNEIELNDEQLAEVTGGKSFNLTDINQFAGSLTSQSNTVYAPTSVFAIGGGKNSGVEALGQGSVVNTGNTSVSLNTNNA
jgi:hypothetical protein